MRNRIYAGVPFRLILLVVMAAMGCGAEGSQTCPGHTPGAPASTGDRVRDTAQSMAFLAIDGLVGSYLRGEKLGYVGSASVSDADSLQGTTAFTSSAAIAGLVLDSTTATLTIASPSDHQRFEIRQTRDAPGISRVNGIIPDNTYYAGSGPATCTGCLPDLFARPAALAWTGVDARSAGALRPDGSVSDPSSDVVSTVDLQLASPCALTAEQILALSGGRPEWTLKGDELVRQAGGSVLTKSPGPRMCNGEVVYYKIDQYVSLTNPFNYGVRNFVPDPPSPMCDGA